MPASAPSSGNRLWLLVGATLLACAVQAALSLVLAEGLTGYLRNQTAPMSMRQVVLHTSAIITLLSVVIVLWHNWSERVDQLLPVIRVLRISPPIGGLIATVVLAGPGAPPLTALVKIYLPAIALTWSAALLVAMLLRRTSFALREQWISRRGSRVAGDALRASAVRLAPSLGRVGGHVAASVGLIAASVLLARTPLESIQQQILALSLIAFLTLGTVALGYAAGRFFGDSYAHTLRSATARFEHLASDSATEAARPLRAPMVDALGEVFGELERLRERLQDEIGTYEQALEKTRIAEETKEQFLAAVSHELRTPLNSICGFAHLMLESQDENLTPAQQEDLRLVRAGGHQLLALIDDILDVTMVETGELNLAIDSEDLVSRLQEIVSIHRPLVRDKALELTFDVVGAPVPVHCDGRRIGQVVTNLLSNAIKFTEQGSIAVRCDYARTDGAVCIEVRDTGVGIGEEELNVIFDAYRQVGDLRARSRGTGLGLAISRTVAERHHGRLWVESRLGKGSRFFVEIPAHPSPNPEARA